MTASEEDIAWFRSTFHPIPKAALPDDCIEYSIYCITPVTDQSNDVDSRANLKSAQKYAAELQKKWLKNYIWQRQSFSLELKNENGLNILTGRTEYGDSIEDEWVIVWLLREISKISPNLWVKVTDSDGEFLLIEASGTLPSWLEPEVAENRVWINNGQLKIVKPASSSRTSRRTQEKLSPEKAREIILHEPKRIMQSPSIEEEAFYRIRNYPAQIEANMHHSLLLLPRKIAFLLNQKPSYVSPAIEAFYLRDPISLKPLQSKDKISEMVFAPTDLVNVSVRFPKVAYAQIKSQDFPPPAVFNGLMPSRLDKTAFSQAEIGMKLTCGFEILLTDSHYQDKPIVREIKLTLEDLETGDEVLPTNTEIDDWDKRSDDEKWLDINFEDLEKDLGGRTQNDSAAGKGTFVDKASQENLQRIIKQFEVFMNDKEGPEDDGLFGEDTDEDDDDELADEDELESDEGEDKDASFDEDEFTKMMQEMMGMPSEVMKEIMRGGLKPKINNEEVLAAPNGSKVDRQRVQELDDSDIGSETDHLDMESIMRKLDTELREDEALKIDSETETTLSSNKKGKGKAANVDEDTK